MTTIELCKLKGLITEPEEEKKDEVEESKEAAVEENEEVEESKEPAQLFIVREEGPIQTLEENKERGEFDDLSSHDAPIE